MSVSTPILMLICCAEAVPLSMRAASAARAIVRFIPSLPSQFTSKFLCLAALLPNANSNKLNNHQTDEPRRPSPRPARSLTADQRAAAILERTERFVRRNGRAQAIEIARALRLFGLLHL